MGDGVEKSLVKALKFGEGETFKAQISWKWILLRKAGGGFLLEVVATL